MAFISETLDCASCGTLFAAKNKRHRFCSPACCLAANVHVKTFVRESRICKTCSATFLATTKNNIYCKTCQVKSPDKREMVCVYCNRKFLSFFSHKKYCSPQCRDSYVPPRGVYELGADMSCFPLTFFNEKEFSEWFEKHYFLYGIRRLINVGARFPDVIAETTHGEIVRIELEFHARNFKRHGHDASRCDAIVCFITCPGCYNVSGVPVIPLCEATGYETGTTKFNRRSLQPSRFLRSLIKHAADLKPVFQQGADA